MTAGRIVSLLTILAVLSGVLSQASAQARPGGGGTSGAGSSSSPARTPSSSVPQPGQFPENSATNAYLTGKVVMEGGGEPPEPVTIVRVCNANVHREAYTDSHGQFSILLGSRGNTMVPDASEGRDFANTTNNGARVLERQLWTCELRADLPGYSSSSINLAGHRFMDDPNVGTIVLRAMGKSESGSVSVTSLQAPPAAAKEYEKGLENLKKEKPADAEKHLAKATQMYDRYAAAWLLLGEVQQNEHKLDDARESYLRASTADPKYAPPYVRLAQLAAVNKQWAQVIEYSDKVIELNPTAYPVVYYYSAAASFNSGKLADAEKAALRAAELDTQHKEPRIELLLGRIYAAKGNYAVAAQHLRVFVGLVPEGEQSERAKTDLAKMEEQSAAGVKQ